MNSNALIQQGDIIQWPWKLLLTWYPLRTELFNMEKDPPEQHDLYWNYKERVKPPAHLLQLTWTVQKLLASSGPTGPL